MLLPGSGFMAKIAVKRLTQLRQTYLKNKRKPVNFMHIIAVTPLIT